ncbi:hypothetical protein [Afipia sp. Root123D2]|nr:hypothetical protein [Afipia sp. Root123D2]
MLSKILTFVTSDSPAMIAWSNIAIGAVVGGALVAMLFWLCIDRSR